MDNSDIVLGEGWQNRKVIAVTFPVPPNTAKGIIYAEDCWSSNALDMASDVFSDSVGRVLGCAFTDRGPAFAVEYPLSSLITCVPDRKNFISVEATSIYCARVGFKKIFETQETIWATEANIEGLSLGSSSCHPGSHTTIPHSPMLTTILQLKRIVDLGSRKTQLNQPFADDVVSAKYFPNVDFKKNVTATKEFNTIAVSHLLNHSTNSLGGLLSQRLVLEAIPKMNTNSILWKKFKNNAVKIKHVVSKI